MQDPCYRRLTEKVELLKPNHQFKPNRTLKHDQGLSSKHHHSWDENTAATPPEWKHGEGVMPIPIEESLGLQIQAEEKLKVFLLHFINFIFSRFELNVKFYISKGFRTTAFQICSKVSPCGCNSSGGTRRSL